MNKKIDTKGNSRRRKRLGECLVEAGLIDEKTLANALEIQKVQGKKSVRSLSIWEWTMTG